jgi:hypothetical protein
MTDAPQEDRKITLKDQMGHILEEARMVLPGIQALFGFQTVAVFNDRFEELPRYAQACHVTALALVVCAIALVMLPAAYHRLAQPDRVTLHTIKLGSRAICTARASHWTCSLSCIWCRTTSRWTSLRPASRSRCWSACGLATRCGHAAGTAAAAPARAPEHRSSSFFATRHAVAVSARPSCDDAFQGGTP